MAMRIMVMMMDSGGVPRAWGTAIVANNARAEAARQLDKYIAKRRDLGEAISASEFKEKVAVVDEADAKADAKLIRGGDYAETPLPKAAGEHVVKVTTDELAMLREATSLLADRINGQADGILTVGGPGVSSIARMFRQRARAARELHIKLEGVL
jgi:hypothetical protein